MSAPRTDTFWTSESGAVTVDWTLMTAGGVGLALATMAVVSSGTEDLSRDIFDLIDGTGISAAFGDLIAQVCAAQGLTPGPNGDTSVGTFQGMPVTAMLIYEASDFVGGLPNEAGARAQGGGAQTLELLPTAEPIVLMVADNDAQLHEVDDSQVIAQDVVINGETYGAGFDVSAAYTLSDPGNDLTLSALHFGDPFSGHWQGPVYATTATNPLEPGASYTFSENFTSHRNELGYDEYLGCV